MVNIDTVLIKHNLFNYLHDFYCCNHFSGQTCWKLLVANAIVDIKAVTHTRFT